MSRGSSVAPTGRRPALLVACVLGGAALALSGCASGQLAQTSLQQSAVDGAAGQVGSIALRNITIAFPDSGRYQKGATAHLDFDAVNEGDQADRLVDVRTDAATQVLISPTAQPSSTAPATTEPPATTASATATATGTGTPAGTPTSPPAPVSEPVPVPAEGLVSFGDSGATVSLVGLTRELLATETVEITFVFERAGEVTIAIPVGTPATPLPPPSTIDGVVGETAG